MGITTDPIETEVLRFEPLKAEHADILLTCDVKEAVWKWLPALPKGTNIQAYMKHLISGQETGVRVTYVLFHQLTNEFMGLTGFDNIERVHRRLRSSLAWHNPDYDPERLYIIGQLAMIQRAYDWGAKRIEWRVYSKNDFIQAGVERLGATREACLRNYTRMADGNWADKIVYSLTRPEMRGVIAELSTKCSGYDVSACMAKTVVPVDHAAKSLNGNRQ